MFPIQNACDLLFCSPGLRHYIYAFIVFGPVRASFPVNPSCMCTPFESSAGMADSATDNANYYMKGS